MSDIKVDGKFGGTKLDGDKPQFGLLPPDSLKAVAEVMTKGAIKYSANNWIRLEMSRILDALERHINAFRSGEDYASDSNQHHLAHAMANTMMAYHVAMNFKDQDDRLFKYLTPNVSGFDLFETAEKYYSTDELIQFYGGINFEAKTVVREPQAQDKTLLDKSHENDEDNDDADYISALKKRSPKSRKDFQY